MITFFTNHLKDFRFKQLISGGGLVLIFKLIGMASGYAFSFLITKKMGANTLGIYTICFTTLNILLVIVKLGLDSASVKFISGYQTNNQQDLIQLFFKKSLVITIAMSVVIGTILYWGSPFLATLFKNEQLILPLQITALLILPNAILHLFAESYRGLKNMAIYSLLMNGSVVAIACIFFVVGLQFYPSPSLPMLCLLGALLILLSVISVKRITKSKMAEWNTISYKEMFSVSIPMLLSGSMFLIMSWSDVLLLGYFLPEDKVAIYNITYKITALTTLALYAVNAIASPLFAELKASKNPRELKNLALKTTKLSFYLTLPLIIVLIIVSPFLLNLFGPEYLEGTSAFYFLIFGQFYSITCGSVLTLLNMTGHENKVKNIVGSTALLNIVLNYFLIQEMGIVGAAIATFISLVVWNTLGLITVKKQFGYWLLPTTKYEQN